MKIDFKKIINIKNKRDLNKFQLDKPLYQSNYLFHYLIQLGNLKGLRLYKFPIYIENNDGLNGFHLAAKEFNIDILSYLIENYPDYIYNRDDNRNAFTNHLPIEQFVILIKKYPKLDWDDLILNGTRIQYDLFKIILSNLHYKELKEFINLYKIKPQYECQYLFSILDNQLIQLKDKIKILDKYSNEEINIKNELGEGIIFTTIDNDEYELFEYLLKREIDLYYSTLIHSDNPLIHALFIDIINNDFKYSKIILEKIKEINKEFYRIINKNADNIAHSVLYFRISRNKQIIAAEYKKTINYSPDFEILKLIDNYSWNQINIYKMTPLNLITKLEFDIYHKIFENKKIEVSQHVFTMINKNNNVSTDPNLNKWIKLFKSFDEYKEEKSNINIKEEIYSHYTLFQAKFKDVSIYSLYLKETYCELLIPNMDSYLLKNLTFEDSFPFSDDIVTKEPIFPWIISYYDENNYYIHPYLNNIINSTRRYKDKLFAAVFISLITDRILHANILIYDFKKMTIERFEPYGNTNMIDEAMDNILEEELTWNTGLKYLRPCDYLPWTGFQTLSDETNLSNQKAGDFGGFCLAWCLWYLETKLKNPEIDSKILVDKVIHKLTKMDIKVSEYIRNYANKINEKRIKYLENIGINSKTISNINTTIETNIILTNYLIKKFNKTNN
jgi:hypothetical protein